MIYIALVLLGLCFGSFVNAYVWRLHELDTKKKLTKNQKEKLSIVHGRSMCVHCHHELAWYDLLPVASWVSLGGKCRYCGRKIDDSPIVEALTAVSFLVSYISWPHGFDTSGWVLFAFWLVFVVGFMALAVYDLKWMLLPNKIVYKLTGLAVLQVLVIYLLDDFSVDILAEALFGFLTIGGLFYLLYQVSGGKWIGGGDVKLSFMIGILVGGPLSSLMVVFIASCLGSLVTLPLVAKDNLKTSSRIPFGPFLLAATYLVYLYGKTAAEWYTRNFL